MSVDTFLDDDSEEIPDRPSEAARMHAALPALGNFISGVTRRGWRVRGVNRQPECIPCGMLGWNWKSRLNHDIFHDRLEAWQNKTMELDERIAHIEQAYQRLEDKLDRIYRALFQQEPPGKGKP